MSLAVDPNLSAGVANLDLMPARFFEATYRRAYSLAFRITGDATAAEAATAAAYSRMPRPPVASILFDAIRKEALAATPGRSASVQVSTHRATAAQAGFKGLPELQRDALELAYSAGMTVTAIAGVLGEDESTIRAALRAALLGVLATEADK